MAVEWDFDFLGNTSDIKKTFKQGYVDAVESHFVYVWNA